LKSRGCQTDLCHHLSRNRLVLLCHHLHVLRQIHLVLHDLHRHGLLWVCMPSLVVLLRNDWRVELIVQVMELAG
jgi:hypothetical protein